MNGFGIPENMHTESDFVRTHSLDSAAAVFDADLRPQHPDTMVFAISDENGAVLVHENAMRPRELAGARIAIGAVAFCAGAGDEFDRAASIDPADCVILGIREINRAVRPDAHAFGSGERRLERRAAVTNEALLSVASDATNDARHHVEIENSIALA